MRSFALATVFAMASALKVKSQQGTSGAGDWQDPAAGGMECANASWETIAEKFTWGWFSVADLSMFTDIKCGMDCQNVNWDEQDWELANALREGWKNNFYNAEWNYVERSVQAS